MLDVRRRRIMRVESGFQLDVYTRYRKPGYSKSDECFFLQLVFCLALLGTHGIASSGDLFILISLHW